MRYVLYCLVCVPLLATAGEVLDAEVVKESGQYRVAINAYIEAPKPAVYAAITDYSNLATINPSITGSRVLQALSPQEHRVETLIRVCILVFCKTVRQVQDVEQVNDSLITAVTLPGDSDFKSGTAQWQLTRRDGGTGLHFTQAFEPDFWVPAIIGPWLIERTLVAEMVETAMYIERGPDAHDPSD